MLEAIQAVVGAAATKDVVPILTHVYIGDGFVQATNGRLCIQAVGATPGAGLSVPAKKLLQALRGADPEKLKWEVQDSHLVVRSGRLRVKLPLALDDYPLATFPEEGWEALPHPDAWVQTLRTLRPFIAQDATRPWACGILLDASGAAACNNVTLAHLPLQGWPGDAAAMVLPVDAVDEVLRLAAAHGAPTRMQRSETLLTLGWDSVVLQTNLLDAAWPDTDKLFAYCDDMDPCSAAGEELKELAQAVRAVVPFSADERAPVLALDHTGVHTAEGDMQAILELPEVFPEAKFRAEVLELVLTVATTVDLGRWPNPVPFLGANGLRGVTVGVRG